MAWSADARLARDSDHGPFPVLRKEARRQDLVSEVAQDIGEGHNVTLYF